MKTWSIVLLIGSFLVYQWYVWASPTPEAWLKAICAEERSKWVGQTFGGGAVRCDRIMEGPGKLVTYEYTYGFPSSEFHPSFEHELKAFMEKDPRFEPTLAQYRTRGIVVEINLYSSDKKMVAALKL